MVLWCEGAFIGLAVRPVRVTGYGVTADCQEPPWSFPALRFVPPANGISRSTPTVFRKAFEAPAIYGLGDPRDGRIRYVGQANRPGHRYAQHWRCTESFKIGSLGARKKRWLFELGGEGLCPGLAILENCTPERLNERERHWISVYRLADEADLNVHFS